jgi:hypothetical protein
MAPKGLYNWSLFSLTRDRLPLFVLTSFLLVAHTSNPIKISKCVTFLAMFSSGVSGSLWSQTLNHGMVRQVFYHCATTTCHFYVKLSISFSILVPDAASSVKSLTMG